MSEKLILKVLENDMNIDRIIEHVNRTNKLIGVGFIASAIVMFALLATVKDQEKRIEQLEKNR